MKKILPFFLLFFIAASSASVAQGPLPTITSATYDITAWRLTVTGTDIPENASGSDIDVSKLTLMGEGAVTRQLTSANVERTNATSFTVFLNSADREAVKIMFNKELTSSTGGTMYNLSVADNWATGADASLNIADATNPVTVSNVPLPVISSAEYNATTGVLILVGQGFTKRSGATNDIIANKFTLSGEGGMFPTLTNTPNVEITSSTLFTLTLSAEDRASVNLALNKNGNSSADNTVYNLSAADDWAAGADGALNVAVSTTTVTVSGHSAPTHIGINNSVINENEPPNTVIGTLYANDAEGGPMTFTLPAGLDDNDVFGISGDQLSINESPDYETKLMYTIQVRVTDAGGLSYTQEIYINVINLNDAPTDILLSAATADENIEAGSTVATLSSKDQDISDTFTYTLVPEADYLDFTIEGDELKIAASPDFETKSSYSFRIRTTDAQGLFFEKDFVFTINDLVELTINNPSPLPAATVGSMYNRTITASGGAGPYTYDLTGGALPAGVSLAPDGTLTGRPTAAGSFTFKVTATDASTGPGAPFTGSKELALTVNQPIINVGPSILPQPIVGQFYSQTLTASGGTAPYTFSSIGTIPPGLTLTSGGLISGTPVATSSFSFSITATDASTGTEAPFSGVRYYITLYVVPPTIVIDPASLTPATVGIAYTGAVTASGGTEPYTYALTSGALPAGILLASDGTLSGTPTSAGSFAFRITAYDATGGSAAPYRGTRDYTFTVDPPTIVLAAASLSPATVGISYTGAVTASGGTEPYTYAVTSGSLPAGISLAADGTLSGTPTAVGTFNFNFNITATDASTGTGAPFTDEQAYSLTVDPPTIVLAPASLTSATVGIAYTGAVTASGGTEPYTYSVTDGALPAGISLAADGTLSGTPTAAGTFNFTITATDASTGTGAPFTDEQAYSLAVDPPTIVLAPASLTSATVGISYTGSVTASGGTEPYTYAVTTGSLPAGLSLADDGTLSGTPTAAGTFNFTITATDASTGTGAPFSGEQAYSFAVNAPTVILAPASLTAATVGASYTETITASGGTEPYTYSVTDGALPAGISFAADGTLSGTPTAGGSFNFTITATDASTGTGAPFSGEQAYSFAVNAPTVILAPASLTAATVGASYSETITASGGTGPYTYSVTDGALPAGISFAADGTLSGTPAAGGSFNFTITATDASTGTGAPFSGSKTYLFTVNTPIVTLSPSALPSAAVASAYSQQILAIGGTSEYTFAITDGALPAGLSLAADGTLSGTPTAGGIFSFTVTATDASTGAGPYTGSQGYSLSVDAPNITLNPAALPVAAVASAYNQQILATGGTSGYTFAITSGFLPAGLSLAPDGTLSGTPTAGGIFNFTITATDASTGAGPYTGSQGYSLNVSEPVITLSSAALATGTVASGYTQLITASGGTLPYTYAVTAGALPAGLSLAADGSLTGIPATGGTFNFTVTATDASSGTGPYTGSQAYSLVINPTSQTITMAPTGSAVYGSDDIDPGATSTNNSIAITYSLSDDNVARIVNNKVHILKAGTVTIYADQAANASYAAATQQSQVLTITVKTLTVSLTGPITKTYDGNETAFLTASNYLLGGTVSGDDVMLNNPVSGTYDNKNAGAGKTVTVTGLGLSGADAANYSLAATTASANSGVIDAKALVIAADNKTRLQGQANPVLTASYSGFITGETNTVLTAQPAISTTATVASLQGIYPITVSGAAAANYNISYTDGTLTVTPGQPTSLTLVAVVLPENRPAGTIAGSFSSTSADPDATFTYSLIAGTGGEDNGLFAISGNQLLTAVPLDYESKASYAVLVRATNQYGLSLDQQFTVALTDVNEAPTLATIGDQTLCLTTQPQTVALSGITAGQDAGQSVSLSVSSDNPSLFASLAAGTISGGNASLTYQLAAGALGTATVTVTVADDGDTSNGGINSYSRSFTITSNALPAGTVNSSTGPDLSKGLTAILTATGGTRYTWANAQGIISGQNSAVLTVRPASTTTYSVTIENASGCTTVQSITINVLDDLKALDVNNVMSPNGDGVNDNLVIKNLDMYPNNTVRVYDRASRLLYEKQNYTNDWNGTLNGSPLAEGTYYYIVDFGPGKVKLKGFVTIVKN